MFQALTRFREWSKIQSTGYFSSSIFVLAALAARQLRLLDGSHPLDPLPLNLRRTVFPSPHVFPTSSLFC